MFKNVRILHVVRDSKFVDSSYKIFDHVAPNCNDYIIAGRKKKLKYIEITPVKFVSRLSYLNPLFLKRLSSYDFVMIHALTIFAQNLVLHSRTKTTFIWNGWGYDYYDLIYRDNAILFKDRTKKLMQEVGEEKNWKRLRLFKKFLGQLLYSDSVKQKVIKKIKFFSPVLENEYSLVIKKLEPPVPKYVSWGYGNAGKCLVDNQKTSSSDNNILIGNSATPTNNHLDIFETIRGLSLKNRKIICPLSYGDKTYGEHVEKKGREYFGKAFFPVKEFMPFSEYVSLISSCSHVIMNHIRQQGGGNVLIALSRGAKVFLDKRNPFYEHYKELGIRIFSIDDIKDNLEVLEEPLDTSDGLMNKDILGKKKSIDVNYRETKELIERVLESK